MTMQKKQAAFALAAALILVTPIYAQNPVPTLTSVLSNLSFPVAHQTVTVEVVGTGFVSNSVVNWNGSPVPGSSCVPAIPYSPPTPGTCWANIDAAQVAYPGSGRVTVVNPAPGGGTSNALLVQVTSPDSTITMKSNAMASFGNLPPLALVAGDFDHDGVPDTAAIIDAASIRIQLGSGKIFNIGVPPEPDTAYYASRIIAADVNGDGYLDLIVIDAESVYVLLNDKTGNFSAPGDHRTKLGVHIVGETTVNFSDNPTAVAAGDFNNDGKLDLAVTLAYGAELAILLGKGDGTFSVTKSGQQPPYLRNIDWDDITVADFNLDGNLDLALAGVGGFKILAGNGTGNFSKTLYSNNNLTACFSVVASDFNGDGLPDVVYLCDPSTVALPMAAFGILLGTSNGSFKMVNPFGVDQYGTPVPLVSNGSEQVVVGDFDGDGKYDLIVGNSPTTFKLLLGKGDGTFAQSNLAVGNWTAVGRSHAIAAADFNADGRLDVVMAATQDGYTDSLVTFIQSGSAQFSPASVTFGNQRINTRSAAQTVTLTNTGSGVLFIPATLGLPLPPFLFTGGSCLSGPGYLEGNSQCTIDIVFLPFNLGPQTFNSPVPLSGTGVAAQISISPGALTFSGSQAVGSTSAAQNITLKNVGSAALNISGITVGNNFTMNAGACGSTLAAGASCVIAVSFQPTVAGPLAGLLTIAGDAINAPQSVALAGNGAAPAARLSASTLNFGGTPVKQNVGQPFTITNNGNLPLTIGSIAVTGPNASDFSYSQNCSSSPTQSTPNTFPFTVAVSQNCQISVAFQPGAAGPRSASLLFYDGALDSPQSVALSGWGWANPLPSVTQAITPAALTAGSVAPEIVRVTGAGFLTDSIVQLNGKPLVTRVQNGNTALAFVSPNLMATASSGWITVVNPAPAGGASNAVPITTGTPTSNVVTKRSDLAVGAVSPGAGSPATAITDLNGDGIADLAVLNSGDGTLSVFLGDGKGGFTLLQPIALPGPGPIAIVTLDVNLDGKTDLAIANSGNSTVSILLGDGKGNFSAVPAAATVGQTPIALAAGDFNRDGIPDVAVVGSGNGAGTPGTLTILLGDGAGGLSNFGSPASPGNFADAIAAADFNGDGYPDLAVGAMLDNTLKIYLGDGTGNFTVTGTPVGVANPVAIVAGDFNNDGVPDLAVASGGFVGGHPNHYANVLLGDGKGGFVPASALITGANPLGLVAADFNNDGKIDLATANYVDHTVSIFLGDGTGNFTATATPATGAGPLALGAADFNGDGLMDLISVNGNDNSVSMFLQQAGSPPASTPADTIWSKGPGLSANQQLTSRNGSYRAIMQTDGNFVVYSPSAALWASGTNGQGSAPYNLTMQSDGNLVLYATLNSCAPNTPCNPTWASHTDGAGVGPYTLMMQNNGSLVVYDGALMPLWSSTGAYTNLGDSIQSNGAMGLAPNQQLVSANGSFRAVMQTDGNFVVYGPSGATWASGTNGKGSGPYMALMQPDGNLVIYANSSNCAAGTACTPTWASNTNGKGMPPFNLIMQNDGNLVVYDSTKAPIWASLSSH